MLNPIASSFTTTTRNATGPSPRRTEPFAAVSRRIVIVLCTCLGLGCATEPDRPPPLPELIFPPPPDPARFVFERTLRGSEDIRSIDRKARLRRLLTGENVTGTAFSKPFDVTTCEGVVYVSDTVQRSVTAFDIPKGETFALGRDERGSLLKPLGLASDAECNVYVADASAARVVVFDRDGEFLRAIGGRDWFGRLSHVAVDDEGIALFVVDTGGVSSADHRVRVFDARTGEHRFDFGTRGSEPGQFNLPRDIELSDTGLVHVVDAGNFRVQVFERDGRFVRSFGTPGRRYGQFSRPKGIAMDAAGNSYVSDAAHGNFQVFDPRGNLLLFVGERSERANRASYMLPAGIDVDEDGRVYMIDQFFRKLDVYRPARLGEDEGYLGVRPRPGNR